MNQVEIIQSIVQTLRGLFEKKDRLTGVGDWDAFIGCLIALERIATELQARPEFEEEPAVEVTEDG